MLEQRSQADATKLNEQLGLVVKWLAERLSKKRS
jgi:hypothetical protein